MWNNIFLELIGQRLPPEPWRIHTLPLEDVSLAAPKIAQRLNKAKVIQVITCGQTLVVHAGMIEIPPVPNHSPS